MKKNQIVVGGLAILFCLVFSISVLTNAAMAGKYKDFPVPKDCMDQVRKEGSELAIYDWAEWWPEELFKNFEKEFGVKVTRDHYADTEEMVTKIKLNPKTPYDLVLGAGPGDAVRLNGMKLLQKLNHAWLPNVDAYLMDKYKNMDFDPGNHFQLIDSIFLTTYTYNSKFINPKDQYLGSWKVLFDGAPKYKGKFTMIDNQFETIGAALKYLGYSWTSDNKAELMKARDVLMKQKPYVMAYDSWPRRLLVEEEAWMSHLWVGDGWLLSSDVPTMRGVMPEEGTYIAGNTDFIPVGAKHPATAHLFLNYLFRTEVNSLLVGYIGYPPAHKHVMEFMTDKMKAWPGFVLKDDYLKKCDGFNPRAITGKGLELRTQIWEELKK
jgi:spermidine/putrescine transport system substrate-binding protein